MKNVTMEISNYRIKLRSKIKGIQSNEIIKIFAFCSDI